MDNHNGPTFLLAPENCTCTVNLFMKKKKASAVQNGHANGIVNGTTPNGDTNGVIHCIYCEQVAKFWEEGTVKPARPFDAEKDAEILRKAMKGMGTDEKAIIDVLSRRSNDQRQEITKMFKTMYGKDLIKELKSELGGNFEDTVVGLMMTPDKYDAYCMHEAISGAGTDEDCIIEIMCSRTNAQIHALNAAYKFEYKKKLEEDLAGDTSGHFKRLMISMCQGNRRENEPVDMARAKQDAQELYNAGEKQWGTDESKFNHILAIQSYPQLRATFDEYSKISKKTIEQAIASEFSGDIEKGLLTIVKVVNSRPGYFAAKLHKSMKGLGTDDRALIRVVVTRCEIDMVQIKQEFQKKYSQSLSQFIADDCSGDYKRMLLALVA